MTKLSGREKGLLVVLLLVTVSMIYYNFFLKGFLAENTQISSDIKSVENDIRDKKTKSNAIKTIDKKLNELYEEKKPALDSVLDWPDKALILEMLMDTVGKHGDDITYNFPPGEVVLSNNSINTVDIVFTAGQSQYKKVLDQLQKYKWVNRIQQGSFIIKSPETGVGECKITMEILTSKSKINVEGGGD